MKDLVRHSDMSRKVRMYFEQFGSNNKAVVLQVADIATMTDKGFIAEKLKSAENRWNESFHRQDYLSQDHKELELDACKFSFDFWKKVADLKRFKHKWGNVL